MRTWQAITNLRKDKYDVAYVPTDDEGRKQANNISRLLGETIDMEKFPNPMLLKDALGLFYDIFKARGKGQELPILIDTSAFKEAADADMVLDIYDSPVKFPPYPKTMTVATALRLALSQVPTNNATYIIRRSFIEITTTSEGRWRPGPRRRGSRPLGPRAP